MSIQTPQPVIPENYNDVTFELEVVSMKTINTSNVDTVSKILYVLTGTDGVYKAGHSRTLILDTEATGSFIEYNNLTKDNVTSWIETLSNYELDKYSICNVILDEKNKQEKSKALPW